MSPALILVLLIAPLLAQDPEAEILRGDPPQSANVKLIHTPIGDLRLTIQRARLDQVGGITLGSIVDGLVTNTTGVIVEEMSFELVYRDQFGQDLRVCDSIANTYRRCEIRVFGPIAPGATVSLAEPGNHFNPNVAPPKGRTITYIEARLTSGTFTPDYKIDIAGKVAEGIDAKFELSPDGVLMQIGNNLDSVVEIIWDQSSFVLADGEASQPLRGGALLIDKGKPQANSVIPPGAHITETLFPSTQIGYRFDKWIKGRLLPGGFDLTAPPPSTDTYIGSKIRLFLRMTADERKIDTNIVFTLSGAKVY